MEQIASIYAPWGGNAEAMAAAIGESAVTVRQWRNRGSIPPRYWRRIIAEAAEVGFELSLDLFADLAEAGGRAAA